MKEIQQVIKMQMFYVEPHKNRHDKSDHGNNGERLTDDNQNI